MHCSRVTTASPSTSLHGAVRHTLNMCLIRDLKRVTPSSPHLAMCLMKAFKRCQLAKPRLTLLSPPNHVPDEASSDLRVYGPCASDHQDAVELLLPYSDVKETVEELMEWGERHSTYSKV